MSFVAIAVIRQNAQTTSEPDLTFVYPVPNATTGPALEPLALGESRAIGPFTVTVHAVDLGADATIAAANQFNAPARDGEHFVLIDLELVNRSGESTAISAALQFEVVDGDGAAHDWFNGRILPKPVGYDEIAPGESVSGQLSFLVPDGASDLEFRVRSWADFSAPAVAWTLDPPTP